MVYILFEIDKLAEIHSSDNLSIKLPQNAKPRHCYGIS